MHFKIIYALRSSAYWTNLYLLTWQDVLLLERACLPWCQLTWKTQWQINKNNLYIKLPSAGTAEKVRKQNIKLVGSWSKYSNGLFEIFNTASNASMKLNFIRFCLVSNRNTSLWHLIAGTPGKHFIQLLSHPVSNSSHAEKTFRLQVIEFAHCIEYARSVDELWSIVRRGEGCIFAGLIPLGSLCAGNLLS